MGCAPWLGYGAQLRFGGEGVREGSEGRVAVAS